MPSMEKQMSTMQKKWKQQFLWKISSSADRHFTYAAVYVDCVENKEWRRRGGRRESGFVVRRCVKKGWQQRYAGHHSCKLQQFSYACGCGFLSSRKMGEEGKEILELNCPDLSRYIGNLSWGKTLKSHNNYTSAVLVSAQNFCFAEFHNLHLFSKANPSLI